MPGRPFQLELTAGDAIRAKAVVIATGVRYRRPDIPNLADFEGSGVSDRASPIEAKLCEGEEIALIGAGNSAGQAVVYLASKVRRLHLVVRGNRSGSVDVALPDRPDFVLAQCRAAYPDRDRRSARRHGAGLVAAVFRDHGGNERTCPLRHLFMFIGADPHTGWLQDCVRLDEKGFVMTGQGFAVTDLAAQASGVPRLVCRLKPAGRAYSPSGMPDPARPSAWRRRWGKAPRWWRRSTLCWGRPAARFEPSGQAVQRRSGRSA